MTASVASSKHAVWRKIRSRWKEHSTEFDISRERVRQIEVRAFEKVQDAVSERKPKRLPRPLPSVDSLIGDFSITNSIKQKPR